ncbi:MAG: lytic transglycosylase domain-containing protein [Verrucomicrobia bacterium]|nr:lytic transglycosylase domain-containing protein [Verrucomicrobiota bacterium]
MRKRRGKGWLVLLAGMAGGMALLWWWQGRLERSQDEPIRAAANRYRIDPALIKAIVWKESRFHPEARGRVGELGLMQLREDAAFEWADAERVGGFGHTHCLDPRTNTLAGTFYLVRLLKRYVRTDDPVPYALADYNAGRANVLKWIRGEASTNSRVFIEGIGFPSTREYVKGVMKRRQRYEGQLGPVPGGK